MRKKKLGLIEPNVCGAISKKSTEKMFKSRKVK